MFQFREHIGAGSCSLDTEDLYAKGHCAASYARAPVQRFEFQALSDGGVESLRGTEVRTNMSYLYALLHVARRSLSDKEFTRGPFVGTAQIAAKAGTKKSVEWQRR